jgi:hypothetical protein
MGPTKIIRLSLKLSVSSRLKKIVKMYGLLNLGKTLTVDVEFMYQILLMRYSKFLNLN